MKQNIPASEKLRRLFLGMNDGKCPACGLPFNHLNCHCDWISMAPKKLRNKVLKILEAARIRREAMRKERGDE